jgi:hypothetical protein
MARLMDAPTWQAANPGKTQQDYYSWMYQPAQYAQKLGATAEQAAAFDPTKSALDVANAGAHKALVASAGARRAAGASNPQRQNVYAQRMQVYEQNRAKAPGFAGVSPGLQAPQANASAPSLGLGAPSAAPAPGGFAGVRPMGSTDRIRQQQAARGIGTRMSAAQR